MAPKVANAGPTRSKQERRGVCHAAMLKALWGPEGAVTLVPYWGGEGESAHYALGRK